MVFEHYYIIKGCKTDQIQVEVTKEAVTITQSFLAKEAITPITTSNAGFTTPTFASVHRETLGGEMVG